MPLTPRTIMIAARGCLALATIGAILVGGSATMPPSALLLAGGGWGAALLVMLGFPRVRKNDLLSAVGGCAALTGFLTAAGGVGPALTASLLGAAGPGAIALTMAMLRVRHLAAANPHMSFTEWKQVDRRRRRTDAPIPVRQKITTSTSPDGSFRER